MSLYQRWSPWCWISLFRFNPPRWVPVDPIFRLPLLTLCAPLPRFNSFGCDPLLCFNPLGGAPLLWFNPSECDPLLLFNPLGSAPLLVFNSTGNVPLSLNQPWSPWRWISLFRFNPPGWSSWVPVDPIFWLIHYWPSVPLYPGSFHLDVTLCSILIDSAVPLCSVSIHLDENLCSRLIHLEFNPLLRFNSTGDDPPL